MVVTDLYSKRQKALNGDVADIYTYDHLPEKLVNQVVWIWKDTIGSIDLRRHESAIPSDNLKGIAIAYELIGNLLLREHGLSEFRTDGRYTNNSFARLNGYILEADISQQLDVIEYTFLQIKNCTRLINPRGLSQKALAKSASNAIDELNTRFKEHGVGYQFVDGQIIRIDSQSIHAEVVKPALRLLNEELYHGADEEFRSAFKHYREGKNKEAINDCLKSFESTLKIICKKQDWSYKPSDTAKKLIDTCFDNNLMPRFLENEFNSLRALLTSGVPTIRNKLSAHGQGSETASVPDYFVSYVLHMTASNLVFLINAEKALGAKADD